MLLVVAIADDLHEQPVALWATHVIRRAGVLARQTRRHWQLGERAVPG
jgi:hypothetical protein